MYITGLLRYDHFNIFHAVIYFFVTYVVISRRLIDLMCLNQSKKAVVAVEDPCGVTWRKLKANKRITNISLILRLIASLFDSHIKYMFNLITYFDKDGDRFQQINNIIYTSHVYTSI